MFSEADLELYSLEDLAGEVYPGEFIFELVGEFHLYLAGFVDEAGPALEPVPPHVDVEHDLLGDLASLPVLNHLGQVLDYELFDRVELFPQLHPVVLHWPLLLHAWAVNAVVPPPLGGD